MDNNYFTIKPDGEEKVVSPDADSVAAQIPVPPAAPQPVTEPVAIAPVTDTVTASATEPATAPAAVIPGKFTDLEPVSPYALIPKSEIKARRKATNKSFRRDALWAGLMMAIFTLMMDFLGGYVQLLGMIIAIPQKAFQVISQSGFGALSDFYYNSYCAEGSKYFALSGITDNICYCIMVIIYCLPFIFFAKHKKILRTTLHRGEKFSIGFLASACVIGMGLLNGWVIIYNILAQVITAFDLNYIFEVFEMTSNAAFKTVPGTIFYLLATCVFAPIGEEFVCRGALLGSLRKYGNWWAVIITAMLFGLMHMNFYQGPYAFLMGLVLGYVAVKTDSIWCSVIIHAINNTYSTVCEIIGEFAPDVWNAISGWVGIVNLLLVPAAIVLICKGFSNKKISLPDNRLMQHPGDRVRAKTLRFCISPINLLFIAFCLLCSVMMLFPE